MSSAEPISHEPARAQRWPDVDQDVDAWVAEVVAAISGVLADELVGVYLHGSLAMGSFHRPKSDLDVLVVSGGPLDEGARRELATALLACHDRRPVIGALELSVITAAVAASPTHPMPYELHFSESWTDAVRRGDAGPKGVDPDLSAHVVATRERGAVLLGPPAAEVLGAVPDAAFRAAIDADLAWILDERGIHESPFYAVLNCCRALHLAQADEITILSKDEGARWALDHVPAPHRAIIRQALACYRSRAEVPESQRQTHGHAWDHAQLEAFRDWMVAHRDAMRS